MGEVRAAWGGWGNKTQEPTPSLISNEPRYTTDNNNASSNKNAGRADPCNHSFIADAVEKVMDSVVSIVVETAMDIQNETETKSLLSSGSGFFIHEDGTILTNAHVVSDMGDGSILKVTTSAGDELEGYIHSMDPLSDLAVVKLEKSPGRTLRVCKKATLSMDPHLRPGDWVIAIGSPFGLNHTVTAGIISSQNRKSADIGGLDSRVEYIQTDCVVHSGSSGGPLVNLDGDVVGINTTRAESEGISFAIRVDKALDIIDQLQFKGKVIRPWLGMTMVTLTPHIWQQLQTKGTYDRIPQKQSGVLITSVSNDTPAMKGGCLEGDVITSVNGKPVRNTQEILKIMGLRVGEPVRFRVTRRIPLDVDWDGRTFRFETLVLDLDLTPVELDVFLHNES